MFRLLIICCITFNIYANDVIKGQTYYQYLLKEPLGYNGAVFAKKYTQAQWETLFINNAYALKELLHKENPALHTFTQSPKFKKITPFLKAFVTTYAKDIQSIPSCE